MIVLLMRANLCYYITEISPLPHRKISILRCRTWNSEILSGVNNECPCLANTHKFSHSTKVMSIESDSPKCKSFMYLVYYMHVCFFPAISLSFSHPFSFACLPMENILRNDRGTHIHSRQFADATNSNETIFTFTHQPVTFQLALRRT